MTEPRPDLTGAACPVPITHVDRIVLGHGSGGKLMHDLIARHFMPVLDNETLRVGDDAATVTVAPGVRWALSTDAHVVSPLEFPGGDIGRLAVCGTVNDVAMKGARPVAVSAGFILEEGLEVALLDRIVASMRRAADEAGVEIVAGDTKVVERGKADGMYITTAGFGAVVEGVDVGGASARPGDSVLLSGTVGDHGMAVLAARGDLGLETDLRSDVAPLCHMVLDVIRRGGVHVLRDPTRGGLATTLNEIAAQSGVAIEIDETAVPVAPQVAAACEMLGFDPLYVANEGKLIAVVDADAAEGALEAMRGSVHGRNAVEIGRIAPGRPGRVTVRTVLGSTRVLHQLSGELLPRIC